MVLTMTFCNRITILKPTRVKKNQARFLFIFPVHNWWKNSYNGHFSNQVYLSARGNRLKSTYILSAMNLRHFFSETYAVWNINSFQVRLSKLLLHKIPTWNSIQFFFLPQADTHFFPLCLPHTNRLGIACKCVSRKPQTTIHASVSFHVRAFMPTVPALKGRHQLLLLARSKPSVRDSGSTTKLNAVPKPDLSTKNSKKHVSGPTLVPHSKVMTPELCSAKML